MVDSVPLSRNLAGGESVTDSPLVYYPRFEPIDPPPGADACAAWRGLLQPFDSDKSAKLLLRALISNRPVAVDQGTLVSTDAFRALPPQPFESRLVHMDEVFDVLVLEIEGWHPRVYCLGPAISLRKFPNHPHLRTDQPVQLGARNLPALCVYSSAEYVYKGNIPEIAEFLGQASIYLAKHLIWKRTRRLFDALSGKLLLDPINNSHDQFRGMDPCAAVQRMPARPTLWNGLWPGTVAKQGRQHLKLPLDGPCWCGKKKTYGECCYEREHGQVA